MILDGIILAILLGFAIIGYRTGFIMAALGFVPIMFACIGVRFLTPSVGQFLRETPMFASMSNTIHESLKVEEHLHGLGDYSQTQMIQELKIPEFLKDALLENNNPVVYQLLDVDELGTYISGFLANMVMNIISVVLVFIIVLIGTKLLIGALNIVSKLPVLNFFNQICGLLLGMVKGITFIWIIGIIVIALEFNGTFFAFHQIIEKTDIALYFYENNILLQFILNIFT